jgi:uncharacterized protein (DUF433 family)
MPTRHLSLRVDEDVVERLDAESRRTRQTRSEIAKTLLDEGLRMEAHPGIVFRPGPAGRRPGLAAGPDVWEIVRAWQSSADRSSAALDRLAEQLALSRTQLRAALDYYADYQTEIDAWIAQADAEAAQAEAAWRRQQQLLQR